MKNQLNAILEDASRQLGYEQHYAPDGNVRHVRAKPAASVGLIDLRNLEIPSQPSHRGLTALHTPEGEQAGRATTFPAAVIASSRALQAGANAFMLDPEDVTVRPLVVNARQDSMPPVMARRRTQFAIVEPAPIAIVNEGDDAPESDVPLFLKSIDGDLQQQFGCRFTIPRRGLNNTDTTREDLLEAALISLVAGIGQAIDRKLMIDIEGAGISAFSLGAVAAMGLAFGQLKALTGAGAAGAAVGTDGVLRVAGIPAELTNAATTASIVGHWPSAALVLAHEANVIAERIGKNGDMRLSLWIGMQTLVPRAHFWTAA